MSVNIYTKPYHIFFLILPAGISFGFTAVTLPYLLTQNGFSVANTAGIIAVGASASLWRFIWGPITDLTLSLRKWYIIAVFTCIWALMTLCFTPFTSNGAVLLTIIVFISQFSANFLMVPVGGLMANRIEENKKGRAGGWYQAGNLGGMGLGGGAGLWLSTHYNLVLAGSVLCTISILSALVVFTIKDFHHKKVSGVWNEFVVMGQDILKMVRIPVVFFIIIMIAMPIGTGAASNLWSAIASDWKTDADTVALVTGILSGLVATFGCVVGGFIADRWGNWIAYLGAGMVCALVTLTMAIFPMEPHIYIIGVLAYSFGMGLINAAFTSVLLFAVGKKHASTKYALLSALGNLPVVYMTAFDGLVHDRFNSKYMLIGEAAISIVFVIICIYTLHQMRMRKFLLLRVD